MGAGSVVAAWYRRRLQNNEYETNAFTGAIIYVFSDFIAQVALKYQDKDKDRVISVFTKLDIGSLLRQYCISFSLLHPLASWFFSSVGGEKTLIREGMIDIIFKTFLEQGLYSPVCNLLFLTSRGILEAGREGAASSSASLLLKKIWNRDILGGCRDGDIDQVISPRKFSDSEFVSLLKINAFFWVPQSLIAYSVVPANFRLGFSRLCSLVWTVYVLFRLEKKELVNNLSRQNSKNSSVGEEVTMVEQVNVNERTV